MTKIKARVYMIENMQIGSYYLEPDEIEEDTWQEMHRNSTFTHNDACEDIFYIKNQDKGDLQARFDFVTVEKDRKTLLRAAKQAQENGYAYICFYAG